MNIYYLMQAKLSAGRTGKFDLARLLQTSKHSLPEPLLPSLAYNLCIFTQQQ